MTISPDLYLAILAMDSYNRGYGAGIDGLSADPGTPISGATILDFDIPPGSQAAGFYAVAYQLGNGPEVPVELRGKTIISYRGTDNPGLGDDTLKGGSDIINGWVVGAGQETGQTALAREFYTAVTGKSVFEADANTIVVGHSLGGGLAGYVSALSGTKGYGVDHMPFTVAAGLYAAEFEAATGQHHDLHLENFTAAHVSGEILESVRSGLIQLGLTSLLSLIPVRAQFLATAGLEWLGLNVGGGGPEFLLQQFINGLQTSYDEAGITNTAYEPHTGTSFLDVGERAIYLHPEELFIALMFASENGYTHWSSIGDEFHHAFRNPLVAAAAGFDDLGGTLPIDQMLRRAVAYSALEGDDLVFGDTAIRAMFNDLEQLGAKVAADEDFLNNIEVNRFMQFASNLYGNAIIQAVVQYSGQLALRKVLSQQHAEALAGIVSLSNGGTKLADDAATATTDGLYVDLSQTTWDIGKASGQITKAPELMADVIAMTIFDQLRVRPDGFLVDAGDGSMVNVESTGYGGEIFDTFRAVYGDGVATSAWSSQRLMTQYITGAVFTDIAGGGVVEIAPWNLNPAGHALPTAVVVFGTDFEDNILGSDGNEVFLMGNSDSGNDIVDAGGGDDIVFGATGHDTIEGGAGNDYLIGDQLDVDPYDAGNDSLSGGLGADTAYGSLGNDTIIGGPEVQVLEPGEQVTDHDDLLGGLGNDSLQGGDGADWLIDNDAPVVKDADGKVLGYNYYAAKYDGMAGDTLDGTGSDTLIGGKGADVFVYTGGDDSFEGGAGDDFYVITRQNYVAGDHVSITLKEVEDDPETEGDETAHFGHDIVNGQSGVIGEVVFEGVNMADVTVNYDYTVYEVTEYSETSDWWFLPLDPIHWHYKIYSVVGNVEIRLNGGESSLTIAVVTGAYSEILSGTGLFGLDPSAIVLSPFSLVFDDGVFSLNDFLRTGPDLEHITKSALSETAYAAKDALQKERDIETDTLTGANDAEPVGNSSSGGGAGGSSSPRMGLYGDTDNELLDGQSLVQELHAAGGNDRLKGGAGGQILDGGEGTDTADYSGSAQGVMIRDDGMHLVPYNGGQIYRQTFISAAQGDAQGDTFASIENLIGSAHNDTLGGHSQTAGWIRGGDGNDHIRSNGSRDTLYGEGGADFIGLNENGGLGDGGEGNDLLIATGGEATLLGGNGNDTLGSYNFLYISHNFSFDENLPWDLDYPEDEIIGYGSVTMDGGAGNDTAEFRYAGGVLVDMVAGQMQFSNLEHSARFKNIENIIGGVGNDRIIGDNQNNLLNGMGGHDTLIGGGGDDTLLVGSTSWSTGSTEVYGGEGNDTLRLHAASSGIQYEYVDGGIRITLASSPDRSVLVARDVETIQFNDTMRAFNDILAEVQTEFNLIGDVVRLPERQTQGLDVLANDIPYGGNPLHITQINGVSVTLGQTVRLTTGSTVTLNTDGTLTFDQAGAYAWLDASESAVEKITYTATDSTGEEKSASLMIIVDGLASEPTLVHMNTGVFFAKVDAANSSATTIANFNINASFIDLNGVLIDPNTPPPGVMVQEINGDTFVMFGDDAVILKDISLDAWKYAVLQRQAAGSGNDLINGTFRTDVLFGGAGNDTIRGDITGQAGGDDVAIGGEGNDYMTFDKGNVVVYGNEGNDTVYSGIGDDVLIGGDGVDQLSGGDGNDRIIAGAGNDLLVGGRGRDSFEGGEGIDTVDLSDETVGTDRTGAFVDMESGQITWAREDGEETMSAVESLFASLGNDEIFGSSDANRIRGLDGDDYIDGRAAADSLEGELGNDTLIGGGGNDTLDGGAGDDSISGGDGDDLIIDTNGASTLEGGAGHDTLRSVFSAAGPDVVHGGDGVDLYDLSPLGTSGVIVDLANGTSSIGSVVRELSGIENVLGTGFGDVLLGDGSNNLLEAGDGNDTLRGGGGSDTLVGGNGNDTYIIDSAPIVLSEAANGGTDRVETSATWTLTNNVENLTLTGNASIDGTGNTLANRLVGNAGANLLSGEGGNDLLVANGGNDTLVGGTGSDTLVSGDGGDVYRFLTGHGADTIRNFDPANDQIEVNGQAIPDLISLPVGVTGSRQGTDYLLSYSGGTILIQGTPQLRSAYPDLFDIPGLPGDARGLLLNGTAGVDIESITLTDAFTIESWIYFAPGTSIFAEDGIVSAGNGVRQDLNFAFGHLRLYSAVTAGPVDKIAAATAVTTGVWTHYAVTRDEDGILRIYVNGVLDKTETAAFQEDFTIGMLGATFAGTSDAQFDEIRIWSLERTGGEIQAGMNADVAPDAPGLERAYSFDGFDQNITDETGHTSDVIASPDVGLVTSTAPTGGLAHLFIGTNANDTLTGTSENDTLYGGFGADSMTGAAGDDLYVVDNVGDTVNELAAGGRDTVQTSLSWSLGAEVEDLTLTGNGAITGSGNGLGNVVIGNGNANLLSGLAGNDALSGMAGADALTGGEGNDTLEGGAGMDLLTGGTGSDTYRFATGSGSDTIADFEPGEDVLEIDGIIVSDLADLPVGISGVTDGPDFLLSYGAGDTILIKASPALEATYPALFSVAATPPDPRALLLNGTAGVDVDNLTLTGAFTIESWIYFAPGTLIDNRDGPVSAGPGVAQDLNFAFGHLRLYSAISGGPVDRIAASTAVTTGQWTHYAVTRDAAGVLKIYVNGVLDATASTPFTGAFTVGMLGSTAAGVSDAKFDNIRVWSVALDGIAIQSGMHGDVDPAGAGLERSYSFDGSGNVIADDTGHTSDLALPAGSSLSSSTAPVNGSAGSDTLIGDAGNNVMDGQGGDDTLIGNGGEDTLIGGAGVDLLIGGVGADQFVFKSASSEVDVITDFNQLDGGADEFDMLVFEGLLVGTFVYLGDGNFTGGSDNSEARRSGNQVLVDTNGDGTADITITLTGLTAANQLGAEDFVFS